MLSLCFCQLKVQSPGIQKKNQIFYKKKCNYSVRVGFDMRLEKGLLLINNWKTISNGTVAPEKEDNFLWK